MVEKKKQSKHIAYVLSIGDEGAILITVEKRKLIKRIFIPNPSQPDLKEELAKYPNAPVYIFIDVVDQSYIRHTMPPVNKSNVKKLAKRKLEKDFGEDDLKTAIPLGRESEGKKEWNYLFISARYISPLSDWVEQVAELPNPLKGVYLLPVECMNHLKDYRKIVAKDRSSEPGEWQIIVSHNRVGGFRQMVFHKEKIIFTRIIQPVGGKEPEVIAGHIEQETENTLEYIRRLGFSEEKGLDLFVITSTGVREELSKNKFMFGSRFIFTPFELSESLNIQAAEEKDRYADVILAAQFLTHTKPLLRLETPYLKRLNKLAGNIKFAKLAMIVAIVAALVASSKMITDGLAVQGSLNTMESRKNAVEQRLSRYKVFNEEFGEEAQKIQDLIAKHDELAQGIYDLFDILERFMAIDGFNIAVREFRFENQAVDGANIADQRSRNTLNRRQPEAPYLTSLIIEFTNEANRSLDKLLEDIDLFTNEIRREFVGYQVNFEGLPSQNQLAIDFQDSNEQNQNQNNMMVFRMQIEGPIAEDETTNQSNMSRF